jgi:hypothetical protein
MSADGVTGTFLVLAFGALVAGASMYWARGGMRGDPPPNRTYHVTERSLLIAAVVMTAIGLVLLSDLLLPTAGGALARAGAVGYGFGGVLVVTVEASTLGQALDHDQSEQLWALAVVYVVIALLAQTMIGAALLVAGLLPAWICWATVGWNIGLLVIYGVKRGDNYIPFVHHLMPFVIGVALLLGLRP